MELVNITVQEPDGENITFVGQITLLKKAMSSQKSSSWLSKGWKENLVWKPGTMAEDSQSSKEHKKELRWKAARSFPSSRRTDQRKENILAAELQRKSEKGG